MDADSDSRSGSALFSMINRFQTISFSLLASASFKDYPHIFIA
jgi:hypothetical protein